MKMNKKSKDCNNHKTNNSLDSELRMKNKSKDLKQLNKKKFKELESKSFMPQILNLPAKIENLLKNLEMLKEINRQIRDQQRL